MDAQEIRDMADDPPIMTRNERYEDESQFVGSILGEPVEFLSPMTLAFIDACCEGEDEDCDCGIDCDPGCGIACDSDCDCL